ncbi:hypothetical protein HYZ06_01220 [Candidatus Daviesbacteria bacterium]|nr:hypothetical protein [Candidatus Daviesbacteria bacterium]
MEKAILKTLIYADIFDYPMTLREVHKWLIGKKANLRQVEKALRKKDLRVAKRRYRERQSAIYLKKAKFISLFLKIIPWIKLVGVSGSLAMNNAGKKDDIDLFLITAKNRLWISRLLVLGLLILTGQRRKRGDLPTRVAGKICINTLLEEDRLEQKNKDIYLAHEVLQMRVLWQREGVYQKYLEDNSWAFKFLPNWISSSDLRRNIHKSLIINHKSFFDFIESIAKWFQLKIMQQPKGMERIEDGALYFHPQDVRGKILALYKQKLAGLDK